MDRQTQEVLEFPAVVDDLAGFAQSAQGRDLLLGLQPVSSLPEALRRLQEFEEARLFLETGGRIDCHLVAPDDLLEALAAHAPLLSPSLLLVLADYLRFGQDAQAALSPDDYPLLAQAVSFAAPPSLLLNRIQNAISDRGEIKNSAHPDLSSVRKGQEKSRREVQEHLTRLLDKSKSRLRGGESFITQRNDRYVIPVRVESQKEIPGLVHGTSSSGATVFIEPMSAIDLNNQYVFYRERESEIIRQVLSDLTREALQHRQMILRVIQASALLDARFATVAYARRYSCVQPNLGDGEEIRLVQARHPVLLRTLGREDVVPLDLDLSPAQSVLVISGPNTGGKTAALKTVGLICLMSHCGLPVPAQEAGIAWLTGIHADIGDYQSVAQNLSTFSSHIIRINQIIRSHTPPGLVLLDEVGRGTDPVYGGALGTAVIEHFRTAGSLVLATTHHRVITSYAARTEGARNASVLLDPNTQRPSYRLAWGVPGDSSGLEIARQLGLPASVLELASSLLTRDQIQLEGYLRELRQELKQVKDREAEYEERLVRLRQEEALLRGRAQESELKRRKEFDKSLERLGREFREEGHRFLKRIEDREKAREMRRRVSLREAALKEAFRRKQSAATTTSSAQDSTTFPRPGELAHHPALQLRGRVLTVEGDTATLEVQGKSVTVRLRELQKIETREVVEHPSREVSLHVVQSTDPELNLVGQSTEEAVIALDKYLDRAFVSRLREVRVIHGFGTGRLKAAVGEALHGHPHVEKFSVEGGTTHVILKE